MNYIVKDDNPDVAFSVEIGAVLDSEGNPIENAAITVEASSTNPDALEVTFDPETRSGTAHFGSPGSASFEVRVLDAGTGMVLGTGGDHFEVTTGDPAAIASINTAFEGLTPTP